MNGPGDRTAGNGAGRGGDGEYCCPYSQPSRSFFIKPNTPEEKRSQTEDS